MTTNASHHPDGPKCRLDLNCDVGEYTDPARLSSEARLIPLVTSVNIACAQHAGSPAVMRALVRTAKSHGVAIGAHPGFRDPEGQGRRSVSLSPNEVETLVAYQVAALIGIARLEGATVSHVKPHGALYHHATRDRAAAEAIARAVVALDPTLILVAFPDSHLLGAARARGLRAVQEAFADRAYLGDGSLVPRDRPGAVLTDERAVLEQVRLFVRDHRIRAVDGTELTMAAETLCVHGDTPGAERLLRAIRQELEASGIHLVPLAHG